MEKQTSIKFILEDAKEIMAIVNCLNYCYHRATTHGKRTAGDLKMLEKLRRDMEIN